MTQREEFEAWAKSKHLDVDYKEKDAWGRELYTPHIQSMWTGWQAAQAAQPAVDVVRYCYECGRIGEVDHTKHRVCCPDGNHALYVNPVIAEQAQGGFNAMLNTAQPAQDGWKLVPIEPTEAMALAALKASLNDRSINGVAQWRAMIAAAPGANSVQG